MSDVACARKVLARILVPLATLCCLIGVAPGQARADADHQRGDGTRSRPLAVMSSAIATASRRCATADTSNGGALRRSAICFVNSARRSVGLRRLRSNVHLTRAATAQAVDMISHDYFGHERAGGPSFAQRLSSAGFRGGTAGEAIAYGCGSRAGAQATVQGWLNSPPHRAVLLSTSFNKVGIGIVGGAPIGCGGGASTWVLDAGSRR